MEKEILETITKVIAWIASLGTGGTFLVLALIGKLTKTVIKLLVGGITIAIAFWLLTTPQGQALLERLLGFINA